MFERKSTFKINKAKEFEGKLTPPSGALRETEADILKKFQSEGGAVIARLDGEPVGSVQYYAESRGLYVGRVAVVPAYRRRGIAKMLMDETEAIAKSRNMKTMILEVRLSVAENAEYYAKLGYEIKDIYDYPEKTDQCYTMMKNI